MAKHLGVPYNLRLPPELKERIAESAKEHNRSINADIVARLDKSFATTYTSLKYIETELLLSVLAEKLAEHGSEITITKK